MRYLSLFVVAMSVPAQTLVTPSVMGVDQNVNVLLNAATPPPVHFGSVIHWDNSMTWYQMDNGCHVTNITAGMPGTPVTLTVDLCSYAGSGALGQGTNLFNTATMSWPPASLYYLDYSTGVSTLLANVSSMSLAPGGCMALCTSGSFTTTTSVSCPPMSTNCGGFHTTYTFTKAAQYLAADVAFGVSNITMKLSATPPWCNMNTDYTATPPNLGTWYACADLSNGVSDTTWTNFLTAFLTTPVSFATGTPVNSSTPGQMLSAIECWNEVTFNDMNKPIKGFYDSLPSLVTMCTDLRNTAQAINPAIKIGTPSVGTNGSLNSNFSGTCTTGNGEVLNACAANKYMGTPGACAAADYVPVHDEPIGSMGSQYLPEDQELWYLVSQTANYMSNCTGRPIWDTEYGASATGIAGHLPAFGDLNYNDYFTLLGGYFAREILMRVTQGVQASYLFELSRYPNSGEADNPMMNPDGTLNPAGAEWNIFWGWIMGASVSACSPSAAGSGGGQVYTCAVTRPGGYSATIAWWPDGGSPGNCSYGYAGGTYGPSHGTGTYSACPDHAGWPLPCGVTRSRDLLGNLVTGLPGCVGMPPPSATLKALPQIFENQAPPVVGTTLTNVLVTNATVE